MVRAEDFVQPKVLEVVKKTDQEVFDTVCRRMMAQELPALRLKDVMLSAPTEDKGFKLVKLPTDWEPVLLDSRGRVSPVFAFFTPQDMRILYREVGFGVMQKWNADELVSCSDDPDDYTYPIGKKVLGMLDHRGVRGNRSLRILHMLVHDHCYWGRAIRNSIDLPQFEGHPQELAQLSLSLMGGQFKTTAQYHKLDSKVLKPYI